MGASNDLALKVLLQASDQTGGVVKGFGASLASFLSNPAKAAGLGMLALGAAVVGVGVVATKMAGDYDQHMRSVQATTGATNAEMKLYDAGLKSLAIEAGVAPVKLTNGLYSVLSASFKGADAMNVLTLATKDAKIGMTDASITTLALTKMLYGFNVPASDFNRVNGEMLRTVTLGSMSMRDYAGAISKSIPVAIQYKDSMENMNAVIATISPVTKSAAVASTDYNNLLKVLDGGVDKVAKSAHKLNSAFDETKFKSMDVREKVSYLNDMVIKHGHNISEVIGKQQNAAQAFTILATHATNYANNLKELSDKQKNAQATQEAWKITQGGFNQTMDRLHATLDVVMISIGQKLLPVVTKFAGQLVPIVAKIGEWLVNSGALDTAASLLGTSLGVIATVIGTILTKGADFVNFLNQGSIGATAVKIVLGLLLGAALGFVASGIPALVIGFYAWATAAGAAAIATLAAALPFILVGIAIAAVVIIIILAVKNWGAIAHWLQGVWAAFSSWFTGAMHAVGSFFAGLWNGLVNVVKTAWNWIVNAVKVGAMLVLMVILGPFLAIAALFIWLYQHNTYFQKLIDAIVNIVKAGVAWLQNAWHTVITWIVDRWNYLKAMAEVYFTFVYVVIQSKILQVQAFIHSILTAIINFFQERWNVAVNLVTQLWSKISGIFRSAWSSFIQSPLGQLLSSITAWFQALPGKALTWGENLIKGFIQGITNMIGAVGSTVSNVVSKVGAFLGFHSPSKEGEGRQAHTWAPNLMKMFIGGLNDSKPQLTSTVNSLASVLGILGGGTGGYQVPAGSGARSTTGPGGIGTGGGTGGGVVVNNITINALKATAKDVAQEVVKIISKDYRRSGNAVTITSGGKA